MQHFSDSLWILMGPVIGWDDVLGLGAYHM